MNRDKVVYLVSETYEKNEYGVYVSSAEKRKVFANVTSVSADEWFNGGRNGLNPELRMEVFAPEYHDEEIVEYNGQNYAIYRTYLTRYNTMELYVQKKKGEQNAGNNDQG